MWVQLEVIILSEIGQKEIDNYDTSLTCEI